MASARRWPSRLEKRRLRETSTPSPAKKARRRFSTVAFPNPDEPGAMDASWRWPERSAPTLACANDPDADRFAVAVRDSIRFVPELTGDQIGVLLGADRIAAAPKRGVVATTNRFVAPVGEIARSSQSLCRDTDRFQMDHERSSCGRGRRLRGGFGYEEALGYSVGRRRARQRRHLGPW